MSTNLKVAPEAPAVTVQAKFEQARDLVNAQFAGRDDEIFAIQAAMVARQHVYMLGPPGTGKSALGRSIASTMDATFWEYLFSRTTTPDEVFGPLDLKALKNGKYERITLRRLPECQVAFMDEIGKANSTIQNALLTAINERVFDRGRGPEKIPLRTVLAASNELPDPKESGAFLDRFVMKLFLDDSADSRGAWGDVVTGVKKAETVKSVLNMADWDTAVQEVADIDASGAVEALWGIRQDLTALDITHTARRWKAIVSLCQASAWLYGRSSTDVGDAAIAEHCLWRFPKEREQVRQIVVDHCAGSVGDAKRLALGALKLIDALGDELVFDDMARTMREVSHVVEQIKAFEDKECDKIAANLAIKLKDLKTRAFKEMGI